MEHAEIVTSCSSGVPVEVVHFYDRLYTLRAVALVIEHLQVLLRNAALLPYFAL